MRQVLAVLGDSFRESVDRRSLAVLLALSLLPIVFCLGLSFEGQSLDSALARQVKDLNRFEIGSTNVHRSDRFAVEFTAGPVEPVDDRIDWSSDVQGGLTLALTFEDPGELDRFAILWFRFYRAHEFEPHGVDEDSEVLIPRRIDGEPRQVVFLRNRFRQLGYEHVDVRDDPEDSRTIHVAVRADQPATIRGAHSAKILFGAWEIPLPGISIATFVILLQHGLATMFVGFVGMLIALFACSSFVPNMLQKGSLDLVLARPIGRTKLLLAKYLGGLWFVLVVASFLVGGCWLGLAAGSGYTSPWFLVSILTLTFSFSALYAVAVAVGVRTRSAGVSAMIAIGVWGLANAITSAHHLLTRSPFGERVVLPGWLESVLQVGYAILPKIKDIDNFNAWAIAHRDLPSHIREQHLQNSILEVDPWWTFGTTTLFTAVVLAAAVWDFRRRDY